MAALDAPTRITGHTPKSDAWDPPGIASDWLLVIDLDGTASLHVGFARKGLLKHHQGDAVTRAGLDALSAACFLTTEPGQAPVRRYPHAYSACFSSHGLEPACITLLQQGIRAQLALYVDQAGVASFSIQADRPAQAILGNHFPGLRSVARRVFDAVRGGRHVDPRRLTSFRLPRLLGVSEAAPPPLPVHAPGPVDADAIVLGVTVSPFTGQAVGVAALAPERLPMGTLVAGATGSGKTNTVHRVLHGLGDQWALVFDVKQEYRSLHATHGAKVYGFRDNNLFTHNLLKPEGPPARWIKEFSEILSQCIFRDNPAVGAKDVVIEELDALYRERGVHGGSADYPHVGHLLERLAGRLDAATPREAGWIVSAMRVLRSLMVGSTRQAFCVREGLALERLMDGITVIELDDLGDATAAALLSSVLLQKIHDRHRNQPHEGLRGLIVVEEAQRLLAHGEEATSVLTTTCREIRATGIGLVLVSQLPSMFSHHALANVSTLVCHRLAHPEDRRLMAQMMQLPAQHADLLGGLGVGEALLRVERTEYVRVLPVERPHVPDDALPGVRVEREEVATSFAQRREVQNRVVDLSAREWELFLALAEGQAVYPSKLKDRLGWSHTDVSSVLGRLIRKGLVRYRKAKNLRGGRPRSIHFLTPYGEEAYRARVGRYADRGGPVDVVHAEVVARVVDVLGIERLPHRRFDILHDAAGVQRAVEVETGSNHNAQLLENLKKSLEHQGEAWFVAVDETTLNRVTQVAARHSYDSRGTVTLHVALVEDLPEWVGLEYEAVPVTA